MKHIFLTGALFAAVAFGVPQYAEAAEQCTTNELDLVCPDGTYMRGIQPDGSKICENINSAGGRDCEAQEFPVSRCITLPGNSHNRYTDHYQNDSLHTIPATTHLDSQIIVYRFGRALYDECKVSCIDGEFTFEMHRRQQVGAEIPWTPMR